MFQKRRMVWVSIVVALLVASLGAGAVMAKSVLNPIGEDGVISGAYQKVNGMLRLVNGEEDVRPSEVFIQWNQEGSPGEPGSPGPQGVQGLQGPTGSIGPDGPQGVQGLQGIQGLPGDIGASGPKGDTGEQGPKGDTGPRGEDGMLGPQGPAGPAGPSGAPEFRIIHEAYLREWSPDTVFGCIVEAPPGWVVVSGGFNMAVSPAGSLMLTTSMPLSQDASNPLGPPKAWICMFKGLFWGSGAIEVFAVVTPES